MNQRRLVGIISVAVIVAIAVCAVLYVALRPHNEVTTASSAPAAAPLQTGSTAPPFAAATTQGYFDLSTTGKPVFAEFFATWCPHCQHETAIINKLYAQYKDRMDFISVPSDPRAMDRNSDESQADILAFQKQFAVRYPIAIYDPNLTAAKLYLQGGYPTVVIIGRDKKIVYLNDGEISYGELQTAINKALS